jgi:hypothetical protein
VPPLAVLAAPPAAAPLRGRGVAAEATRDRGASLGLAPAPGRAAVASGARAGRHAVPLDGASDGAREGALDGVSVEAPAGGPAAARLRVLPAPAGGRVERLPVPATALGLPEAGAQASVPAHAAVPRALRLVLGACAVLAALGLALALLRSRLPRLRARLLA